MSLFEKLRNEITAQSEGQEELQDLDIEGHKIGKFTKELAGLFEKHSKLTSLAISDCSLTTLDGFPNIAGLESLLLESNKLEGPALKYIPEHFKRLVCLSLAENSIKTFEDLQPLSKLEHLQQLDLSENPVASLPGYHKKVFEIIPSLKVLDNKDADGKEIEFSDDEDGGDDDDVEGSDFDDDEDDDDEDVNEDSEEPVKKKAKK